MEDFDEDGRVALTLIPWVKDHWECPLCGGRDIQTLDDAIDHSLGKCRERA